MKTDRFKKRIVSVFIVFLFMIVLFCFSKESTGEVSDEERSMFLEREKENAALEGMNGENVFLTEMEKNGKENVEEAEKDDEAEKDENAEKADGVDIMGMAGIKYGKELSKEVVRAMKKGDTKFLTGIEFGEEFDYERYRLSGKNEYYAKEALPSHELHYFFDGKGHRFSGFSYEYVIGCEPFLEIEANDRIAILMNAFGIPDVCEECTIWGKEGLRADWYFERAVLTLYESNACVWGMRMAEASYKYYDGVPFPFLTEDWNIGCYDSNNTCHLCRDQKTWFLEKNAGINDKGRVKTVSGNGISDMKVKSYFINFDKFTYRADGNLKAIREEIPTKYTEGLEEIPPYWLERPYFGEMEFRYDPGGTLKK